MLIVAVDQGTTNTKAVLVDRRGRIVARAGRAMALRCPQPGWAEQDAAEIAAAAEAVIAEVLAQRPPGERAVALAITNQRESAVVWDRATGQACGPCVIWQCRRTMPMCAELRGRPGLAETVRTKTGLDIDPLFSATKVRWLIDQIPDGQRRAEAGELCAGTVDSWLLWKLAGEHACDTTNASRTQLLSLAALDWDAELLEVFGLPRVMLPRVQASSSEFGVARGCGLPVRAMIGDSHAALFAHAAFRERAVKATYGTGSSLMTRTPGRARSRHGLSSTVAWTQGAETVYALEGNITHTGGAVQWMGEVLGFGEDAASKTAELAASVADSGGVYVVPALAGLGAPYWRDDVRGTISGLTRASGAAHLARATVDAIAYQVRDVFDAMVLDTGDAPEALLADGGASRNDALMQFQADMLGLPVIRNLSADLSALGAAWLAGLGAGVWSGVEELASLAREEQRFHPAMAQAEREARYAGWRAAVARAAMTT